MGFSVPQLEALHKAIALQRDGAACAASTDHVAHLQNFRLAIPVMDHDAVKFNWRVLYANLQETIAAPGLPHFDVVMVMLAVNMGLAKINPVVCMG